jgi:hypothetical protein
VPGDDCIDRVFAARLSDSAVGSPAASLVVAQWTDPGGDPDSPRFIAPLHIHHEDDEAWYALVVRAGESDHRLGAGGAVLVPRGVAHTCWNPTSEPTAYVLIMTRQIQALINALHSLPQPDEAAIAALFDEHASEYLGWP